MLQTLGSSGQGSRSQCIDAFWDTEDSEFKIKTKGQSSWS